MNQTNCRAPKALRVVCETFEESAKQLISLRHLTPIHYRRGENVLALACSPLRHY
jgi:hypothetical protein